ncbi:MAG: hypothetical protein M1834_001548 [Cirrosporium novae-zelandiae]|nr:MAG: hypothetical protein M1834_004065 [Cirrosporium novae-zelandiae]KAI9735533.1 MAG: hypothetical protein M1834_001548 [Cirrosporium novae-zelandiae]
MAYIAPIHRPSSVRHALKLNFLSEEEESLIVAKANRLEIYSISNDGLALQHSSAIYGKVTMLSKHRPVSSPTDHLFVGTDRYTYFSVCWDPQAKKLCTVQSSIDLAEKFARDSQNGDRCLLDPTGRFMTLELFEGSVTVVPIVQKHRKKKDLEIGSLGKGAVVRIPELFIRSSTFLHPRRHDGKEKLKMAFLYEDNHQQVYIKLRQLEYSAGSGDNASAELDDSDIDSPTKEQESGASHLIPVPSPIGGVIILGETQVKYLDERSNEMIEQPLKDATVFATWEAIDDKRWLLGDEYGYLHMLMLVELNGEVQGFRFDTIGEIPCPTVLVYLDGGYVFVGSHQGDSQLIKINEGSIEVIQSLPNIAPILDFTIMDMGSRGGEGQINEFSSGQARIVTGSGAFKDGSLRSIRSGVGLADLGILGDLEHITDLFALRSNPERLYNDTLLVSFMDETRIFAFTPDGDVEELSEFKGLDLSSGTLFASNLSDNRALQVTASEVRLIDLESGMVTSTFKEGNKSITAVSTNDRFVLLSIGGLTLTLLDLSNDLQSVTQKTFPVESQIACIALPPISTSNFCLVGFWQSGAFAILNLERFEILKNESLGEPGQSVPRSILLTQVLSGQSPTIFIAMADGNVITFSLNVESLSLSAKKSVIIGTQQANFKVLPRGDGLFNVFAMCEHPSLIYGSEGRLVFSAVTADKASCVCHLNTEAFPGSIAIATPCDLRIAVVDDERTTHVQTLSVHETVRRIAYSTKLKSFGMGTIKRGVKDGEEFVESHFKLADEVLFKELDTYALNKDELVESVIRAELPNGNGGLEERFVVGTAYLDENREESVRGRIIVFDVTPERTLEIITENAVRGACRALAIIDDRIVAALVKTVLIYAFKNDGSTQPSLEKVASYRTSTAPIDITVTGNLIAISDLMKSVSVVEYKRNEENAAEPESLVEVARHYSTLWGTAIACVADDTWLEGDAEGNLIVLHRNINGLTEADRRRLDVTSDMLLGEMVNRIRPFHIPVIPGAAVIPRAFLATVEGSIYLFALIAPAKQNLLMQLQSNLANFVKSPGGTSFNKFRAFKNTVRTAEEPFRFVDGELVEKFLDCSEETQEKAIEGLGADIEEIRAMVEGLRRLH